ncbi:MAG TPA: hypothetical protein DCS30_18870 [Rhizobiales bacterium]|nr:hypothetical protein [Hyphomicrobiales bacterium]
MLSCCLAKSLQALLLVTTVVRLQACNSHPAKHKAKAAIHVATDQFFRCKGQKKERYRRRIAMSLLGTMIPAKALDDCYVLSFNQMIA